MDKFASLRAFTSVVEENGFAAAARALGLSRSQVNKLVVALEADLGAELLIRTTRKISPTSAGRMLYERAKAILEDLTDAEAALKDLEGAPSGELRINAPMSFGSMHLADAVADFVLLYPGVRIELVLSDRFVDPVAEGFDLTVRISDAQEFTSLIDHRIMEAKRVICASPSFIEQHGEPRCIDDLQTLPCLHYGAAETKAGWTLVAKNGLKTARINPVMFSNNGEILRTAATKGVGLALLPTFIVGAELQSGRLVTVLNEWPPTALSICLLYAPKRQFATRMRLFIEFFYKRFGDRPYWDLVQ
ncbi:MAG: LysR family transcriptional regulator [Alphaproteobacteria bacterium]|nr:LysR family transcriptional regulator [Alphaproteobacteria bacterium]